MKKVHFILLLFLTINSFAQIDYSDEWEDFFSYNNIKDFIKIDNTIYALSDNAVFTYETNTNKIEKFSSIQGLSGESTSSIYYHKTTKRLIIGYENGLLEVIDDDGTVTKSSDLLNFSQTGQKRINHISEYQNKIYLSTPFGIVTYNIEKLEFGDTYFIGNNSTEITVNKTIIQNDIIYAATQNGIYTANAKNTALIDFNNWKQYYAGQHFKNIIFLNNKVYVSETTKLHEFTTSNLILIRDFFEPVININSTNSNYTITLNQKAIVFSNNQTEVITLNQTTNFNFTLSNSYFENNTIFLGTKEFGILKANSSQPNNFEEIHPDGPSSNDLFSIAVKNNHLWVVYGGYNLFYGSLFRKRGFSHFNGENWVNVPFNPNFPVIDLNYIAIDPNHENRVYISSFGDTNDINSVSTGGLLVVENDKIKTFYNHLNSGLEDLEPTQPNRVTLRISGSIFDSQGNLWVSNIHRERELKKLTPSGQWSQYNLADLKTIPDQFGLSEIAIDNTDNIWMGTRRNGIYVFNENGNRKRALIATPNLGNLPDTDVLTVVADASNRIWMGTRNGLAVFTNAASVFSAEVLNAQPIIIEENGVGERLLGDQKINSIAVDGADNKWFGTENGGVLYTNPSGQRTIATFSKENSPLPSNTILKIAIDKENGKVFFATDKGIVAYNSNVAPFGEELKGVYAYPNPALSQHNTVTIIGRNGNTIPKGTNVKILDVAGNLVYETNVVEGQELQGGKVVWNKTNLAGKKVASGVYIVLLATEDAAQTTTTKIAIVN